MASHTIKQVQFLQSGKRINMTPRQIWFKKRIDECLDELSKLNKLQDWIEFKNQAHELACELLYATTEWDKYYRNISKE